MTNLVDKQCKETGWMTPPRIVEPTQRYAHYVTGQGIYLDPATTKANPVGAKRIFTPAEDGLEFDWAELARHRVVYLNPPYGKVFPTWVAKVGKEAAAGAHMVCLFPAQRFETAYYHQHVFQDALQAMVFVRKRVAFLGADGKPYPGNPYGSVVLLYNGNPTFFGRAFAAEGAVVQPRLL